MSNVAKRTLIATTLQAAIDVCVKVVTLKYMEKDVLKVQTKKRPHLSFRCVLFS